MKEYPGEITKYMSTSFSLNEGSNYNDLYATKGGYSVYSGKNNTRLYVVYRISENDNKSDNKGLREKLKARAKSAGLLSYTQSHEPYTYDGGNFVFMYVLRLDQ